MCVLTSCLDHLTHTRVQEPEFQKEAGTPPDQGCGCSHVNVTQGQVKREHGEAIMSTSFHCT